MFSRITPLQKRQLLTFSVAWLAYASTYLLRKPLGVIKSDLQDDFSFTEVQLGWFDMALLLPYATMQMVLGPLADKYGTRKTLSVCLILSAVSMIGFGKFSNFYIFCVQLFFNGMSQAVAWPSAVKALGSWYPSNTRNSIMGIYGTCAFAGGIAGTAIALVMGLLVYLVLHSPEELNVTVPGRTSEEALLLQGKVEKPRWLQLWKIAGVPEIAIAMFCLKVVRYCIYMWLPLFLLDKVNYSKAQAGLFSTIFEIGGVLGSMVIGILVDRLFRGHTLAGITISAVLTTVATAAFFVTNSWGLLFNVIFLLASGAFNCGPDTLLGSSVPMELGEANGQGAGSAVIGLVNGFGSIGTFLEGPIMGFIIVRYEWNGMAIALVALSALGTLATWRASRIHGRAVVPYNSSPA